MSEKANSLPKQRIRPGTLIIAVAVIGTVIIAGLGIWYIVRNPNHEDNVPECPLLQENESELIFSVDGPPSVEIPWMDITIMMSAEPNDPETYYSVHWDWNPTTDGLSTGETTIQSLNATGPSGSIIFCNVTDISGNGYINDGDFFSLALVGDYSFLEGIVCHIMFIYKPMAENIGSLEFIS